MVSKLLFYLLPTILLANYINCEQYDFCSFGLSSTLNGRAYSVMSKPNNRAEEFKNAFEETVRLDKIVNQFKRVFGESLDTVKSFNWYYNFGSLGRINISEILPASLHCVYVYDREHFTERYEKPAVTAEDAVQFVLNEVIYQAAKEAPTYVRLPLLEVSEREAVGCNFAKGSTDEEEYFLVHCIHDDWSGKALKSTKMIEKSTRKEFCVSDVVGLCENELKNMVDTSITVDVSDEEELKKLISSMNCINCTININVQPKE